MKKAIQTKRKVVLTLMAIIVFWFAGQGKALSNIGPLLADDIAISTDQCRGEKADIAFDGQRYLVVWAQSSDLYSDIYGRFITTSGSLDGGPFLIATDIESELRVQHRPAVAFNGTYYMVVYYDNDPYNYYAIRGQRVGVNGDLIGSNIQISSHPYVENPDVASDGTNFLVIWDDKANFSTTYGDIAGQLISSDGMLIGTNFKISGPEYQSNASVEFGSNGYLVAWHNRPEPYGEGDIYGALVDIQGNVSEPIAISTAPGGQGATPGISFDGTTGNYLVVWADYRDPDINKVYGARVSKTGLLLDGPANTGGIFVSDSGYSSPSVPQVAFDGIDWLVVWGAGRLRGSRVSTDGNVLDPSGISLNMQTSWYPRMAFDGTNYMVTWYINDSYSSKYAQLIGPINTPPTAVDDIYSTDEDTQLIVSEPGVLGNDSDDENITAVLVTSPSNGNLTLNSDGSFTYTPNSDFNGLDEFIYKAYDNDLYSELAVATITVNMVNDPPLAKADGPFLGIVGEPVKLDASASSDTEGAPLTYKWDFGDDSTLQTTDPIVEYTYDGSDTFEVTLVVNDGDLDSDPFFTTATIGVSSTGGGGGRDDVNAFLSYLNLEGNRIDLSTGTTSFKMTIIYGAIDRSSFEAILNKVDQSSLFNPIENTFEEVEIPLDPGRNVLVLKVTGTRSDGRTATDRDRITFIVP